MAIPTTPPGFGAGFDADLFRESIRAAMTMGLPNTVSERATFRWHPQRTFAKSDPTGKPYDLSAAPVSDTTPEDVQIPCAVEFSARPAGSMETALGEFDTSRVIITLLDVDMPLISGADEVILGGNTYDIQFLGPPIGLFDVTVYQLFAIARDES